MKDAITETELLISAASSSDYQLLDNKSGNELAGPRCARVHKH